MKVLSKERFAVSFLLGLVLTGNVFAITNLKLNAPLVEGGQVYDFQVSPEGNRVVYRADQDIDNLIQLYSVPIQGNVPPVKLNAAGEFLPNPFVISPDGNWVVYHNSSGVFSVPSDGATPRVEVSAPLAVDNRILSVPPVISSDNKRVVYLTSFIQNNDEVIELYSAPIEGGTAPVKLNAPLVTGGDVDFTFHISPDGSRVVYVADQEHNDIPELYSVSTMGGSLPVKLSTLRPTDDSIGSVVSPIISPDGNRVVYLVRVDRENIDDFFELYSAPIEGGSLPVRLNAPLVTGGNVSDFRITPDGSRVIYIADQDTDQVVELYSVPIAGGSLPVKLNAPLVAGGNVSFFSKWQIDIISPDSQWVVYLADQDTDGVLELYSVPIEGNTPPVKLNSPLISGGNVSLATVISPDSSRVIYSADQQIDGTFELFSVPINGGALPSKLNTGGNVIGSIPLSTGRVLPTFPVSPDSSQVMYMADQNTNGILELFSVPIEGGTPIKINGPMVTGGQVLPTFSIFGIFPPPASPQPRLIIRPSLSIPVLSSDGNRVVYRADQDTDDVAELYVSSFESDTNQDINLNDLVSYLFYLPDDELDKKIKYRLIKKLERVEKMLCKNNFKSAIIKMKSLKRKVNRSKKINQDIAEILIYSADNLIKQFKILLNNNQILPLPANCD